AVPSHIARRIKVAQSVFSVEGHVEYRSKTQGYRRDETTIAAVIDSHGREVDLAWDTRWQEVAPGIETLRPERVLKQEPVERQVTQQLRIQRSACPVYVLFVRRASVVPYGRTTDFGDTVSQQWVCYERA
ncbi:MAG: hypothetical protein L6Q83_12320, partial [Gammaproteobacteria bacterium]|nr:hypothetical protein [Gammaproteobacteria bacterium]